MHQRAPLVVLVAEDDLALRYLAKRQLARLGFACELAEDGAEGGRESSQGHICAHHHGRTDADHERPGGHGGHSHQRR